ncbi:MAG: ABC transporter ATP-binding protein [Caldiserica bacterium]|nr:MAG: ABC transporter ATP-binding protein [Caldisericota bacterium]
MIKVIDISKSFHGKRVLDGISFEVEEGTIFSLIGPNGAGKTTTFKILSGILRQDSGSIYINGKEFNSDDVDLKRNIFFIPDNPFLYDKLTGREFIDFILKVYKVKKNDIEKEISYFDMDSFIDSLIETYSHGYRKRLLFTCMRILKPYISILDEPLVGLDPFAILKLKKMLEEFKKEGKIIFLSLHTLEFAEIVSDRVAIIDKGRIVEEGGIEELKRRAGVDKGLQEIFLKLLE